MLALMLVQIAKSCFSALLVVGFVFTGTSAGAREFTSKNGSVMQADLVSHSGGQVKIRRDDGKEFEIDPSIFSAADEKFIRKWIAVTPEMVSYNFSVDFDRKKVDGETTDFGYKRVKNQEWSYVITIRNRSKDTVSGITIEYRILYTNHADGEYSTSDTTGERLTYIEGSEKLKQDLAYNRELILTTRAVKIDDVVYYSSRHRDELKGCLMRILDPQGKVINEWVSNELTMKGRTWNNTQAGGGPGSKTRVIIK